MDKAKEYKGINTSNALDEQLKLAEGKRSQKEKEKIDVILLKIIDGDFKDRARERT